MEPVDFALLILRLWLGTVMLAHGVNHARNLEGTASWFASKGFRQPRLNAMASAGTELAIGFALIAGLLTSLAAAGLIAITVTAFGAIHRFAGFFVFARPDEGYEYVATLAVASLALAILGPGSVSVDSAIGVATNLDGWTGLVIALAGAVAGILQLALLWRKPTPREGPGAEAPGHDQ
jgi:putative oxidoreductase